MEEAEVLALLGLSSRSYKSSILTVCGASYHIKGKIYRAEHVSRAC